MIQYSPDTLEALRRLGNADDDVPLPVEPDEE